jgi:cold shock CspA family protein
MVRGTVVSFDRTKGYGFVSPETGGDDVFLHVNDLMSDKNLLAPGIVVEFRVDEGDRGPKASAVNVLTTPAAHVPADGASAADSDGEDLCDVLSSRELEYEVTELLLRTEPPLHGAQILDLRRRLLALAQAHGWADR